MRDRVQEEFIDLGEKDLKNIARPVRAYAIKTGLGRPAVVTQVPAPEKAAPPRVSIVVLPFTNIGGDSEQEYFADGVTESLTTDLSRIAESFVIARNTAFSYKGKPFDVKQIGRELNVRYVLEGSVQRSGSRLRVNVQLINAKTGAHLWAERFDKPVADLFEMQDEIVARLANALGAQLIAAEARRAERSPYPDSLDLLFQAADCVFRGITPAHLARARELLQRALAFDPANIDALVWSALVDTVSGSLYPGDRAARLATAEANVTKALSVVPNHSMAHLCMGLIQIYTNRASQGLAEFERALQLDPNNASVHAHIGHAKIALGRAEETEAHVHEAFRLSPRDQFSYLWMHIIGMANLFLGRDEEAVAWLRRGTETNRNYSLSRFYLAAALAHCVNLVEASGAVEAGLALDPTFTIAHFRAGAYSDNPVYLAGRERLIEGMRQAGVPEG